MIKKILVAYDNGDKSQKALESAIELAKNSQAEIYIVTSVEMPGVVKSIVDREMLKKLEDQNHDYFSKILEEAAAKVKNESIPVQTIILHDRPGEAIVKFAEKEKIDLIVMGAHNRGPVERFFLGLGSVSNYVLNQAKCLVLIAKA